MIKPKKIIIALVVIATIACLAVVALYILKPTLMHDSASNNQPKATHVVKKLSPQMQAGHEAEMNNDVDGAIKDYKAALKKCKKKDDACKVDAEMKLKMMNDIKAEEAKHPKAK